NPSVYGQSVNFTATVTGSSPTGTVQFYIDSTAFGSGVTLASGSATSGSISTLAVGNHVVTAIYSGDTNNSGSTGTLSGGQSVSTAGAGSIGVTSSLNPSTYGQSVTFTASIPGQYGQVKGRNGNAKAHPEMVTGSVTWSDSNGPLTCTESGTSTTTVTSGTPGIATCTTSALAAASSDTITGTYSGDSNHSGGSGTVTQEIDAASAGVSVGSSANPSTFGQSVTFTATISGEYGLVKGRKNGRKPEVVTGSVTWSDSNGPLTCTETGSSTTTVTSGTPGTATCTTGALAVASSDTITGTYSGDSNHSGGSGTVNQEIDAASASVSVGSSSNPSVYGQSVTFTATITGANGNVKGRRPAKNGIKPMNVTGTVAWSDSNGPLTCSESGTNTTTVTGDYPGTATCTTSTLAVASSDTITGAYSGDSSHGAASGSVSQEIEAATSSVSVATGTNPVTYGQSVTFTATISGENGLVKGRRPAGKKGRRPMDLTGTVTWASNGNPISDCGTNGTTAVTSGNPGSATCTTSTIGGGTDTITATYSGDGNHSGSMGTLSGGETVNPASQVIALSSVPANAVYNTSFTVVASASSGLPVAFTSSGACSNSGATYTMTSGTGKCTVIVDQGGNNDYSAAPEVTATLNAVKAYQSITVTEPAPASAPKGTVFTVAGVSNVGLPITYSNQNDGICTNSGATFTLTGKGGTCFVSFNAAGNSNYEPNSIAEQTVIQAAVKPTVSFTGAPASAAYQSTFTVSATSNSTSTPTITAAGACSISGTTVTMTLGTGTCTLTAKWAANNQYLAASATQKTTAEKLTSTVTWSTPAPITYGTKLSATQLNATANVAGRFVYSPKSGTTPAVPTPPATCDTLTVTFTPTLASDYTTATASVCLVVNQ
ncbi:MAG: Ig-like domain-containing protein, partial [Terriglobales bacterium]